MKIIRLTIVGLAMLGSTLAAADDDGGSVHIPLEVYQALTQGAGGSQATTPAGYALGDAHATVTVAEEGAAMTATVHIRVSARILGTEWTLVPLLPGVAAVTSATVDGQTVHLLTTGSGLSWATNKPGTFNVQLTYQVDASRVGDGRSVDLVLPPAASTQLTATIPGHGLNVALIPSTAKRVSAQGANATTLRAIVPGGAGAQLSWRAASGVGSFTISRATYQGELTGNTVTFRAEYGIEVNGNETVTVGLLPSDMALRGMQVGNADAPIAVVDDRFAVTLRGRGKHVVKVLFEIPVIENDGLPGIDFSIPEVPISKFQLSLPGQKRVDLQAATGVTITQNRDRTIASFHVAMTDSVSLSWPEAVPEDMTDEIEARANASIYHVVHAEEGVLYVRAITKYEVSRGKLSQFEIAVPSDVMINAVTSSAGEVSDWRLSEGRSPVLTVFLDREVDSSLTFEISYEMRLEPSTMGTDAFDVPLLEAKSVHRQRGMVALLSSRELTLEPKEEQNITRVGDNQLPASVRDTISLTVAHTFRYAETTPSLSAITAIREREQGKFDAEINTLISLADVTSTGSATLNVHVKSGSLMELTLVLPEGVNFLDLSAPSLREHNVEVKDGKQLVHVEFTQEMEGQFRVEVSYEKITAHDEDMLQVPTLHVQGADVEHGRIAVEALVAVQIDPSVTERLSPIEVAELPQQLILRTTNPILLAYKYVQADPPPELALRITRHQEIATHDATIDEAVYRTLYTEDGFAVTKALFTVRNQRKQFLRVQLPPNSEVWSARVNGQQETPAIAEGEDGEAVVLINVINSTDGFPVELIYASRVPAMGVFGRIEAQLPKLDMVVTRSRLEVFLPNDQHYGEADGDMKVIEAGHSVSSESMGIEQAALEGLHITVPGEGQRFSFEKLYAGQGDSTVAVSIPYASGSGNVLSVLLSLLGTFLLWLGALGFALGRHRKIHVIEPDEDGDNGETYREPGITEPVVTVSQRRVGGLAGAMVAGALLLGLTLIYVSSSSVLPVMLVMVLIPVGVVMLFKGRVANWLEARAAAAAEKKAAEAATTPATTSEPEVPAM